MDKNRFSLLQLDPGEIYFEDFSVVFIPADTTQKTYDSKKQDGRLKMCSKSLVFEPKEYAKPLLKIPFKACTIIEQWKGNSKFIKSDNVLAVNAKEYVEMFESNVIAPYKSKGGANFLFILNYGNIFNCLPQISQLHRASTLPAVEQIDMIATIVHSRQARISFDKLWLDMYEKIVLETEADKVTPLVINPGRVLLSDSKLYFQPYNNVEPYPVIKVELKNIQQIVKRRFLLRHIGLEIYSSESCSNPHIYLSFYCQKKRDEIYNKILNMPKLKLNDIQQNVMTLQWQNGVISNYDYLCYINSLGDRTINDLTQYPVFPWIISNYSTNDLDLNDEDNYRDLSKPVGALNSSRLEKLLARYDEMPEPKFLYGSHYSTPGFVLFYLARLYPHYVLCLQSGCFDHPDRMFNSVAEVYKNCLTNMSDFKELIPEFYDTSQKGRFLINDKGINFGYRFDNRKVGDVELPTWARNSEHFIETLRNALESDIVSKNLHSWIDLIFGYAQKGEEAIKAHNLFYYMCYEGNVDLDAIVDLNQRHAIQVQIMEFGQIPKQVFKVPHPQRKIGSVILRQISAVKEEKTCEDSWIDATDLNLTVTYNTHKNIIGHIFISHDNNHIISVGHDSKLKVFSLSHKKQIRSSNIGNMPLSSCLRLPNANIIVVGSWDNQIILFDLDYGRVTDSILAHEDAVTCLCWGEKLNLLVSGSDDCTIKIWKGFTNNPSSVYSCLYKHIDHNSRITCVSFDSSNKYLAVGTYDGEICLWETKDFLLYKKHSLGCSINAIEFSPDGLKLAFGQKDKIFQIIDINSGLAVLTKALDEPAKSLKWKDFLLVIGCENGLLYIWNIIEVKILLEVKAHDGSLTAVDIAPDKSFICTGSADSTIKVWYPKNQ